VGGLVVRCREMVSSGRGRLPEEERWSEGSWMRRWWAVGSGRRKMTPSRAFWLSWVLPRNTSCIVFLFLTAEYRLQKDNIT
jgi:hypothetical protein